MAITLRALRANLDMTQREAAVHLMITPETLGKWENGKTFPDVPHIRLIEKLYDVKYEDINFLLKESDEE